MRTLLRPIAAALASRMLARDWDQYASGGYSRDYPRRSAEFIRVIPTDLGIKPERLLPPRDATRPSQRITDAQKYGSVTNLSFTGSISDQLVLTRAPSTRVFLAIQNNDAVQNLFVAFGGVATTTNGIKIAPGQTLFFDAFIPQDDIHIVADGGTPAIVIFYSNKGEQE